MYEFAHAIVAIAFFSCVAAIIIAPMAVRRFYQNRERERLHETLRLMVERGQPISGDLLDSMKAAGKVAGAPRTPPSDLRRGVVLLSVALGIAGLGLANALFEDDAGAAHWLVGIAAFPGFIGLGYIVLALATRNKPQA